MNDWFTFKKGNLVDLNYLNIHLLLMQLLLVPIQLQGKDAHFCHTSIHHCNT